jgi:hypothetical protein
MKKDLAEDRLLHFSTFPFSTIPSFHLPSHPAAAPFSPVNDSVSPLQLTLGLFRRDISYVFHQAQAYQDLDINISSNTSSNTSSNISSNINININSNSNSNSNSIHTPHTCLREEA